MFASDLPVIHFDFRHSRDLRESVRNARLNLARTEKLKQDRNQGGTGNVVVLAG
jgi:hypothetical protein